MASLRESRRMGCWLASMAIESYMSYHLLSMGGKFLCGKFLAGGSLNRTGNHSAEWRDCTPSQLTPRANGARGNWSADAVGSAASTLATRDWLDFGRRASSA
jgi:hypothetical protein